MYCPTCDNELQTTKRQGIGVRLCPGCRGAWLLPGELDRLLRQWSRSTGSADHLPADRRARWPQEIEYYDFG